MIKFKKEKRIRNIRHELSIIEFNIETLNNNISNLVTCFKNHRHELDMRDMRTYETEIQRNTDCQLEYIHKMSI